jgi:2-C-methyl-D-erythritol 4-phosphate cytidylyltransferase
VGVVLAAAGQSLRLGGGTPKQYRELGGVPILLRSLRPFTAHPDVAHVVVVLPASDIAVPPAWLAPLAGAGLTLVAGGAERSDSVAAGLAALPGECTIVLVHDAARPLVDRQTIDGVIAAVREGVGAVPAIPVGDTLKEADEPPSRRVLRTVPRDRLYRVQTPQGFPRALLEWAHGEATGEGLTATDDAALVERLGSEVRLVPGSPRNFKVTAPEDFELAEAILRGEKGRGKGEKE